MAKRNPTFSATGSITDANGFPAEDVQVELLLVNLRTETPLGQSRTDEAGAYRIAYAKPVSHAVADLRIRVRDSRGGELAESPVLYRAPLNAAINLSLPDRDAGKSGLTQLVNRLQPLLGNVKLSDLREDREVRDVSQLSAATGESPDRIVRLQRAYRLEATTRMGADLYFAWLEAGLPDDPGQLAILPTEYLESALKAAASQGLIENRDDAAWKKAVADIKRNNIAQPTGLLRADILFQPFAKAETSESEYVQQLLNRRFQEYVLENMPDVSPETVQLLKGQLSGPVRMDDFERALAGTLTDDGPGRPLPIPPDDVCKIKTHPPYQAKVGEVLQLNLPLYEHPILSEPLRRAKTFAYAQTAGLNHAKTIGLAERGLMAEEWSEDTLRAAITEKAITAGEAQKLSRIGVLSRLIGTNPDLVNLLYQNAPENLVDLVAYTPRDFQVLIERNQVPLPSGETPGSYASTLALQVETAFPLPYFVHHRLEQLGEDNLLRKFHQNNPSGTWAKHDWLQGDHAAFKWTGIPSAQRPEVTRQLAADQRLLRLSETPQQALALRNSGFDSARSITRLSRADFAQASGFDATTANRIYTRAQEASGRALHAFTAIHDLAQGGLSDTAMGNIAQTAVAQLFQIEGMSALFGPEQFCDCAECRSVLSPAAYLVDMLGFLREKIKETDFSPEYESLKFLQRRPDLAKLPLTCANTKNAIPYLTIVNEVLAEWLRQQEHGDPLELAAQSSSTRGFLLPFNLPMAELRLYLSHFNLTPFDLYTALNNPDGEMASLPAAVWPLYLKLDETDIQLITTPNEAATLERYRINAFTELTPEWFVRMAGTTRKDLSDLLDMRFNPDLKHLKIVLESNTDADDVQAYREVFQGMTPAHADYLYRFVRLWRKTSWTVGQLDAILIALPTTDTHITKAELLEQLSKAAWLQQYYRWSVPELCAFLDKMPVSKKYPQKTDSPTERGLLEQVFDLEAIFGSMPNGDYAEAATFLYDGNDAAHVRLTALLTGALKINQAELRAMLEFLGGDWPGKLHRASLSLLYRHVQMARHLGWPVQEWLMAAELLQMKDPKGLSALTKVHAFSQWQKALGLLPSEMMFFQGKTTTVGGQAFNFVTPELTNILSKVANAEDNDHTWPTKHLKWKEAFETIIPNIRARLNVGPDLWNALLEWTPIDIASFWTDGSTENLTLDILTKWSEEVERVLWVVQRLGWTELVFIWLTEHPAKAKIANRRAKNFNTLKGLAAWHQLMPTDPEAAAQVLKTLDADGDAYAAWASHWKMEWAPVTEMKALLGMDDKPSIPDIKRLRQALDLGKRLGASSVTLAQLGQYATYTEAKTASEIALQLIQAQYQDEKERLARVEPYTDKVNSWKRDVLVQYILTRYDGGAYPFEDESSLFAYFLLDVEMEGCFRTSRIVAAHGSIQLYIHRILMNLEQSADGQLRVLEKIADLETFKTEWEWRKNYRVWEANRKVFLYPENYLEPDLRDNKTPIFRELEEELLQRELDQENAELAWRNYFEKYTDLAELRIAGSFFEKSKNTYHFFGRTPKDPFQYYYRRWENQRLWTPWEAMDLPIPVREVTGIVYNGQTHVFWAEVEAESEGNNVFLNMSHLRANGRWSTPQRLEYSKGRVKPNTQIFAQVGTEGTLLFDLSSENGRIVKSFDLAQNVLKPVGTFVGLPSGIALLMSNYNKILDVKICDKLFPLYVKNLNIQSTNRELTESEIDSVQGGVKAISESHIRLTQPLSNQFLHVNHIGGTRNQAVLEVEKQKYLVKNVSTPELNQGLPNPPITTYSGIRYPHEFFTLITLGHNPVTSYPALLGEHGLAAFLDTITQEVKESGFPLSITNPTFLRGPMQEDAHMHINGPYGDYLRELFFHVPFHIAHQMNANQRFKEAKWWYERIFDPTASGALNDIDRPWRYIEFKNLGYAKMKDTLQDTAALERYRLDPFNPHAIARLRLSAYQKTIVMKYVDNLVDWGDQLFAQYQMESINEALMLYQLASDILGKRPIKMGACPEQDTNALTYEKILQANESAWDAVLIWLENLPEQESTDGTIPPSQVPNPQAQLQTLLFCIPHNADLHEYWDRVADRLYKIRHCLDLNGQPRQIPLFAPAIDPMLLVRAKAMGLSLEQVLDLPNTTTPHYRFAYLIERAKQYTQTVQSFGSALLSALNSKDAEQLTLLRSVQEREILRMGREVRKRNLEEAKVQVASQIQQIANVDFRLNYYKLLIGEGRIQSEEIQDIALLSSNIFHIASSVLWGIKAKASMLKLKTDDASGGLAEFFRQLANSSSAVASIAGLSANHQRRNQEWEFQEKTATQELKQLDQQLLAAEIRVAIAEKDLETHERSMEHADEVYAFYRDKFTNLGLFNFMSRTLHTLHRQAYNLAYEAARQAESAWKYERDVTENELFIGENWSGDRAGLLSGERLMLQIQQLERKYEEQNTRDLELTKHISLNQLNPFALLELREKGTCTFDIPEELFDLDFPGHYMRRIKSVSISLPCVAGPYTSINATLRLTKNEYRRKPNLSDPLIPQNVPVSAIATSSAQNDSGLFELNFRDERYLPFEGAGAISAWTLEMMTEPSLRQFDYNTIADVVVHLRYTAREDGGLKTAAITHLKGLTDALGGVALQRLFSLRHDFPNEWHRHAQGNNEGELVIQLKKHHFPYWVQMGDIGITGFVLHKNGMESSSDAPASTISDTASEQALRLQYGEKNRFRIFLVKEIG
jgi:hypothetical protein